MRTAARVLWSLLAMTVAAVWVDRYRRRRLPLLRAAVAEAPVDDTLDQSFPASDPPSWSSAAASATTQPRSNGDRGHDDDA